MSEESTPRYSAFWPVAILLGAFAISYIYQIVELISHRSYVNGRYAQVAQNIPKAQEARDRLVALLNDLARTGAKDPNALAVVQLAAQNGIIHERPGGSTPAADTNAAPSNP